MKKDIVITGYDGRILTCLYEDDSLSEIWVEAPDENVRVGDIFNGRVMNIVKNINAAFVEIMPGVMGYYSLRENRTHHFANTKRNDKLAVGDEILVQVSGENLKTKDWPLSSEICLQGSSVVYFPGREENRVSRKIRDPQIRESLQSLPGSEGTEPYGWTFRTSSAGIKSKDILAEMRELQVDGNNIMSTYKCRSALTRLGRGSSIWENVVKRFRQDEDCRITTDLGSIYEALKARKGAAQLELYKDPAYSLIKLRGIESQIKKACQERVWLPCGGYLVIQQTEAMCVIDVNTGKNTHGNDIRKLFFKTNLEALAEAFRQIRIRNLSGIIVIDLINMKSAQDRKQLLDRARELAEKDPVQTTVVDLTGLQLLEITRRKDRHPLSDQLKKNCSTR